MEIPCVRKSADYHELLDAVMKGLMATGVSYQEGMNADKMKSKK